MGRLGHLLLGVARCRDELRRHAVAEGDRSRLVQEQGLYIPGRFDGAPAHGQHVPLHEAVHAGDPDGREQGADGGRYEADEQGHQDDHRDDGVAPADDVGVVPEGLQDHHHRQEDDGQDGQQDRQGDLVGGLLAVSPFYQADHPVEEGVPTLGRDADHDPVGKYFRATGDGGTVAPGLADHRRRLSRDGGLVDRGDPLDDLPVRRDEVTRLAHDAVTLQELHGCHPALRAVRVQAAGLGLRAHPPQRVRLGLSPAFGHSLGKVGEDDG